MNNLFKIAKKYPLTLICIVLICYLSIFLIPPKTALDDVAFIDKWTHLVMYGGTTLVVWGEYARSHQRADVRRLLLWGWLALVAMGGLLELLQAYATTTRQGDWLDFAANTVGVTLGALVGWGVLTVYHKR